MCGTAKLFFSFNKSAIPSFTLLNFELLIQLTTTVKYYNSFKLTY